MPRAPNFTVRTINGPVPEPRSSTTSRYGAIVDQVAADTTGRELVCPTQTAAEAAYAGIKRAIQRTEDPDRFRAGMRAESTGSVIVFVEINSSTDGQPPTTQPKDHANGS